VTADFGIVTAHFGWWWPRISAQRDRPFRHLDRSFRRSWPCQDGARCGRPGRCADQL